MSGCPGTRSEYTEINEKQKKDVPCIRFAGAGPSGMTISLKSSSNSDSSVSNLDSEGMTMSSSSSDSSSSDPLALPFVFVGEGAAFYLSDDDLSTSRSVLTTFSVRHPRCYHEEPNQ